MYHMIKQLREATGRLRRQLPYLPMAFRLVRHAAGGLAIVWVVLLLVQGLLPVATVYLTRTLVDGIAAIVGAGGGWKAMIPLLPAGIAMALVLIGGEVFQGIGKWVRTDQSERVQDHVHELIHEQAMLLDLSFYDNPGYYDQLHRARIDALNRPAALIENTGALVQSFITLAAMGGVLLTFGIWIPLLLAFSTLPALLVVLRHTIRFHRWRIQNTTAIRKTSYYDLMLTQREAAAEMRLFGLGPHFRVLFQDLRKRLRREEVQLARSEAAAHAAAALIGLASMAGAMAWMGLQALKGAIGLGDLALFYQAFYQGQRMMRSLLGSAGEIYRNIMFLENLFEFLALKPRISSPERPLPHPGLQKALEFQNVTFSYPGTERHVIEGFNLQIPAGRITALVGENGAGKTTLIKLICRFYDPEKGRLLIDGTDIRALPLPVLRQRITVLFQDPMRYHDTVFNNIAFGDIDNRPGMDRVEAAAKAAGADAPIRYLPGAYGAVLGKWFGGAELSGGEWQRLALARAFLRNAEFIILDEPTSAMDSWAEADWLLRFRRLVAGRTALIITHRFTTALHADVIHVIDSGRIIESGSHEELLAAGGRYESSWTRQMRGKRV
ncbi:MAG: Lipid A export ATP-binding/permease protein MsbA [Syntrophorhabdus sp. PtaU1.Bin058]|nr:MAG: Lipid A export ATP-binding/permease protein MsbA [Syntrophorhabdus sp. PtaU1.Bin058]